ncbi:hypothetical protein A5634_09460 [Mycobacterium asiaticum]|uniref:Uncharacterized protein n=1 Tax=Mycobacterium asiaticum TaxID=1790 RepID=A0A1A3NI32_MYCAS|nr:hypothetical protein [Mycobacterium asiaticum]OBK21803.1 hypothetical protein A5634_09460 [Mycobacterium asiaticum]
MEKWGPLLSWGIPALVLMVVLLIVAGGYYRIRKPRCSGPPLTGIARIESLESAGSVVDNRYICKIVLRVEIPGREPYDATVRRAVNPVSMASVQPGKVVAVQVDSTDPQKVLIDPSGPIDPWTNAPDGPPSAAALAAAYNRHKQSQGSRSGRWASTVELLASGQRVPGVLRSFAATGNTLRTLGRAATAMPELLDAPQYVIEMELRLPNLAPVVGRSIQSVPTDHVPHLAIGRELPCVVDPSDPTHCFVVDWERAAH